MFDWLRKRLGDEKCVILMLVHPQFLVADTPLVKLTFFQSNQIFPDISPINFRTAIRGQNFDSNLDGHCERRWSR